MEASATVTDGLETVTAGESEIKASESCDQRLEIQNGATAGVQGEPRGVKRPAEDEDEDGDGNEDGDNKNARGEFNGDVDITAETVPLSKNQMKKLKRQKRWEEKKQHMKAIRKVKKQDRKERKKLERDAELAAAAAEGRQPVVGQPQKRDPSQRTQVPVTIIIDCQFEKYMMDKELVSLCSQVTRCYSENRNARFPLHTFVSSYCGAMKTRFETALESQHQNWKGIHFREGDFVEVAREAKELMASPKGGKTIELLGKGEQDDSIALVKPSQESKKSKKTAPVPELEADDVDKSIVYLTADSPYTLERLEPNTCYVIGGIIDKNREKGLCYKLAREKNVRTAKLPIGEFMVLQSRHVLATNHVMDIMLKYLELGDWGAAFMKVIPPRKGGKLKDDDAATDDGDREGQVENESKDGESGETAKEAQEDSEMQEVAPIQADQPLEEMAKSKEPEVEGPNLEDGLQKNVLSEKEWSAPPIDREKIQDLEGVTIADP